MEASENTAINSTLRKTGQFVPAQVLESFSPDFMDAEQCRRWILERLHPLGPRCPGCGSRVEVSSMNRFWSAGRICCRSCGKFFSAMTGTFLQGTHMNFSELFLLALFLELGIPDKLIAKKLEVNQETIRLWRQRFQAVKIS